MIKKITQIKQIINDFLYKRGIENPEIRWLVSFQLFLVLGVSCLLLILGLNKETLLAFVTGAALITFNFYVLAKVVPKLILVQKGAVGSLLFSFYSRLILTAIVLYVGLVLANLPILSFLAGLSTIICTIMVWTGKFIITYKHKEA